MRNPQASAYKLLKLVFRDYSSFKTYLFRLLFLRQQNISLQSCRFPRMLRQLHHRRCRRRGFRSPPSFVSGPQLFQSRIIPFYFTSNIFKPINIIAAPNIFSKSAFDIPVANFAPIIPPRKKPIHTNAAIFTLTYP